jgi:hypothetical protein
VGGLPGWAKDKIIAKKIVGIDIRNRLPLIYRGVDGKAVDAL